MSLTPSAAALRTFIRSGWPNLRIDDGIACRKIAGSDRWSQHAYGNALDMYGTTAELEDLYQALQLIPTATEICYNHRGGCTTPHTDHLHVAALPRLRGTPACAKALNPNAGLDAAGIGRTAAELTDRLAPDFDYEDIGRPDPGYQPDIPILSDWGRTLAENTPTALFARGGLLLLGLVLLTGGGLLLFRQVTPAGQLTKLINAPA